MTSRRPKKKRGCLRNHSDWKHSDVFDGILMTSRRPKKTRLYTKSQLKGFVIADVILIPVLYTKCVWKSIANPLNSSHEEFNLSHPTSFWAHSDVLYSMSFWWKNRGSIRNHSDWIDSDVFAVILMTSRCPQKYRVAYKIRVEIYWKYIGILSHILIGSFWLPSFTFRGLPSALPAGSVLPDTPYAADFRYLTESWWQPVCMIVQYVCRHSMYRTG